MSANERFFEERRPQAVFKHAVLSNYLPVLFRKVSSMWPMVYVDGYAGRGEYADGSQGSPLHLIRSAAATPNVRGIYVERDPEDHAHLAQIVAKHGRPTDKTLLGDIAQHLPAILQETQNSALFVFLDPFGAALDRSDLVRLLSYRRTGSAPVEVLLHFSITTIARLGGLLRTRRGAQAELTEKETKTIDHGDRFLGGPWWQEHFRPLRDSDDASATEAAMRVASDYQAHIRAETGVRSVSLPIRPRPDHHPKYLLVLFTRHGDGQWAFADALGRAGREWQAAWRTKADNARLVAAQKKYSEPALFELEPYVAPATERFDPVEFEKRNADSWRDVIADNITALLAEGPLCLADRVDYVYGDVLGLAWEKHVRAAVKKLHSAGHIDHNGVGRHFYRDLIRARA